MEETKGKFIVIEGADGVGSTTQACMLEGLLNKAGMRTIYTAQPSGLDIGAFIRDSLKHHGKFDEPTLALLFAADRVDHYNKSILPVLKSGTNVISDRYLLSSYVYQTLSGTSLEWVKQINQMVPPADKTILITLPFDDAWNRVCTRISKHKTPEEIFDKREIQQSIHAAYDRLLTEVGGIAVDGRGTPLEVLERVKTSAGFLQ